VPKEENVTLVSLRINPWEKRKEKNEKLLPTLSGNDACILKKEKSQILSVFIIE
jgi:hypothetical protein